MTRPIRQSVTLAAPAASLYRTYLNAKTHAAITGGLSTLFSLVSSLLMAPVEWSMIDVASLIALVPLAILGGYLAEPQPTVVASESPHPPKV